MLAPGNKGSYKSQRRSLIMFRRMSFTLVLLMLAIALIAAGKQRGITMRLTYADSGSTITLHPNDTLELVLPGNPTTGYTWEVKHGSEALLKQQGEPVFTPDSKALGSEGRMTFRFDVVAVGKGSLVLLYRRTFEPEARPLRTFGIRVVVAE
jgi:inhibitor of cysteine peptidase